MAQPPMVRQFSGVMNTDDNEIVMPATHHRFAKNVRFRGNANNQRLESIQGTTEIVFAKPLGDNQCIGAFYDGLKQFIYFFNWNSNENNGIYRYNIGTGVTTALILCGTNSSGDILNFDLDYPIASVNILYTTEEDGDILHWIQRNDEAKRLNIKEAENNIYGSNWLAEYLTVIKAPPMVPAKSVYENDTTVSINNLRNALFQFCYRYVYTNNEKSVWSSRSIVSLPNQPTGNFTDNTATNNSRISVSLNSGGADVFKIELAVRIIKGLATDTEWYLVNSYNKADLSIPNNEIYSIRFYNNGVYSLIDPTVFLDIQDYVQRTPNTQELLNGSTLILGGGVEGFDKIISDINSSSTQNTNGFYYDYNGLLFFATINGNDSGSQGSTMKIYVFGTGINNGSTGVIETLNNANVNFIVNVVDGSNNNIGANYTGANSLAVTTLLAGISSNLVANGWTQVSLIANVLTVSFPTTATLQSSGTILNISNLNDATTSFAYPFESGLEFGIIYFDDYGRTNGVTVSLDSTFNTPISSNTYNFCQPKIQINHRPPIWAKYYNIVRSNNTTYSKRLNWVTDSAYSSPETTPITNRFVYLGIDNIKEYNDSIEATSGVVGYDFSKGDRVRFLYRYDVAGTQQLLPPFVYDYEIMGVVVNPQVDGKVKDGTFIKISYPSADISGTFKFDGSADYLHYQVLIYNYISNTATKDKLYHEFGKRFGIGNYGTVDAYHMGLNQTQSSNLSTPAIIDLVNGDLFYRKRTVPYDEVYNYPAGGTTQDIDSTLSITVSTPVDNAAYRIQTQLGLSIASSTDPALYPNYSSTYFFYNKSNTNYRLVRLKMSLKVGNASSGSATFGFGIVVCTNAIPLTPKYYLPISDQAILILQSENKTLEIDTIISVPYTGKIFPIVLSNTPDIGLNFIVYTTELQITVKQSSAINIIEQSFTDVYNIVTNSNGRTSVVDENANELRNDVLVRWSLPYIQNTNINGSNTFRGENFDEIDREKGPIQRFKTRDKSLLVFQNKGVGRYGIYSKYIRNNSNQTELVLTDEIITANNIQYYEGEYGMGKEYCGLASSQNSDYIFYPVTGAMIRIAGDGMTNLTELYKGQFYLGTLLTPYNQNYIRSDGSTAKILAYYDFLEEQAVGILQGGSKGSATIDNYAFSFNETRNAFCSFYDYLNPDWFICAEDVTYSWKNGSMYVHNDVNNSCRFYGTQYYPSVKLVFNDNVILKKNMLTLGYESSGIWAAPLAGDIYTGLTNPQTGLIQQSLLKTFDIELDEGKYIASFWRDINSQSNAQIALLEGDNLQGFFIVINFVYSGTGFSWLYLPYITWSANQRNF